MEKVVSNSTQAVMKTRPNFADRKKDAFREHKSKVRVCRLLHRKPVFDVFHSPAIAYSEHH